MMTAAISSAISSGVERQVTLPAGSIADSPVNSDISHGERGLPPGHGQAISITIRTTRPATGHLDANVELRRLQASGFEGDGKGVSGYML
jgi:hypothetical protein